MTDHALFVSAKEVFFAIGAIFFRSITVATEIYIDWVVILCRWIQIDISHTLILLLNLGDTEWLLFAQVNTAQIVKEHVLVVIHLLLSLTFTRVVKACSGGIKIHDLRWSHAALNS